MSYSAAASCHLAVFFFLFLFLSFFFFLSEVGVKSLKYRVQGGPEGNKHRPGFVYSAPEENRVSAF